MPDLSSANTPSPEPEDRRHSWENEAAPALPSLQERLSAAEKSIRSTVSPIDTAEWAIAAFRRVIEGKNLAAALLRALETRQGDTMRIIELANVIFNADPKSTYVRAEHLVAMSNHGSTLSRLPKREQYLCVTGALQVMQADATPELLELYLATATTKPLTGLEKAAKKPGKFLQHAELMLASEVALLASAMPSPEQLSTAREAFASLREKQSTLKHFALVQQIITACNRSTDISARESLWRESKEIWQDLRRRPHAEAESLLASWSAVMSVRASSDVCKAWRMAVQLYLVEGDVIGINMLTHHLKEIIRPGRPPQLLRQFIESLDNRSLKSAAAAINYLSKLAAHGAAFALSLESNESQAEQVIDSLALYLGVPKEGFRSRNSELQDYIDRQILFDSNLAFQYESGGFFRQTSRRSLGPVFNPSDLLIPPAARAYNAWRRIVDVHDGFGALRTESQRTPDGEMPSLVRFARSVGKVVMLNARDSEHFPGKGFYISGIELDRIFVPDPKAHALQGGPYYAYKNAWPGYSQEFDDLANAEFIFTRGMIIISCARAHKYDLEVGGSRHQMSLVILNAHFSNPNLNTAFLVDTASVRRMLRGTGIALDHFKGFDANRADLNQRIPDVSRWFTPEGRPEVILNVGEPSVIAKGLFGNEAKAWQEHLDAVNQHNELVKDWDARFRAARAGNVQAIPDYREEYKLQAAGGQLEIQYAELAARDFGEKRAWDLVHRLMNLYDLFRVGLSYQHRGYIRGKQDDSSPEPESEVTEDESIFLNPNANFILHEAMRWHSQRARGVHDRSRFPVAVIADGINHALGPVKPVMLDSYDMAVYLDGKKVTQLAEGGTLSFDDEVYWQTVFLPLAKDEPGKFLDVRLLPRDSLGS